MCHESLLGGEEDPRCNFFPASSGGFFFSFFCDFPRVFSCSDGTDAVLERYLT